MDAKTAFISTRPWSFTMTFSAVTTGSLVAAVGGRFNPALYAITLAGMICFHAATNVLNDFFDVRHGVDREGAPTTKYRLHPAAFGQAPLSTILGLSVVFYGLTTLAGVYLSLVSNLSILLVVAAGMAGSILYTADPVILKARALGEATVFAMWGVLIPLGSFMVQTGVFSWMPIVASVPIGIFVALVLLANNIRDIPYDGSTGSRTLAVVLGVKPSERLYALLLILAYGFVIVGILIRFLPLWSLAVFLTAPGAKGLLSMFRGAVPDTADPRTAGVALQFAVVYMASLAVSIFIPLTL